MHTIFITDHKRLWNYFALSKHSAFGKSAILFETVSLFVFDSRVIIAHLWICVYNLGIYIAMGIAKPSLWPTVLSQILVCICCFLAEYACVSVCKHGIRSGLFDSHASAEAVKCNQNMVYSEEAEVQSKQLHANAAYYPVGALFRTVLQNLWREVLISGGWRNDYMHRESAVGTVGGDADGDRGTAASSLPLRHLSSNSPAPVPAMDVLPETRAEKHLRLVAQDAAMCSYYNLLKVGANFLDSHTIYRFHVSNTIRHLVALVVVVPPVLYAYNIGLYATSCVWGASTCGLGMYGVLDGAARMWFVVGTLGGLMQWAMLAKSCSTLSLSMAGMWYGAMLMRSLCDCWVNRYSGLRLYSSAEDEFNYDDECVVLQCASAGRADAGRDADTTYPLRLLKQRIQRDAYEHYLFIQQFVGQASALFSPLLLVIELTFLAFIAIVVYSLFTIVGNYQNPNLMFVWVWLLVWCAVMCLFPIYTMASANESVQKISACFKRSSTPADFEVLGGREEWATYLADTPAYWTIFGVPITVAVLYSMVGTFITGTVTGMVAAAFSFFESSV